MDLNKTIRELYDEREKLDKVILALEELHRLAEPGGGWSPKRRGRKSMNEEERREVSERMKKYWADRRRARNRKDSATS